MILEDVPSVINISPYTDNSIDVTVSELSGHISLKTVELVFSPPDDVNAGIIATAFGLNVVTQGFPEKRILVPVRIRIIPL